MARVTKAAYEALQEERDDLRLQLEKTQELVRSTEGGIRNQYNLIQDLKQRNADLEDQIADTVEVYEAEIDRCNEDLVDLTNRIDTEVTSLSAQVKFLGQTVAAIYKYQGSNIEVPRILALGALADFGDVEALG